MTDRHAAAECLLGRIAARDVTCGIVGLGFIGRTAFGAALAAGFRVVGYDRNPAAARCCERALTARTVDSCKYVGVSSEPDVLADADAIVVAVRLGVASGGCQLEPLRSAAELVGRAPRRSKLIVIASTVPPGTTRAFAEWIESDSSAPVFVAHSPERLSVGEDSTAPSRMPRLLGGVDPLAAAVARTYLETFTRQVVTVRTSEVSEVAKLLENASASVNIALMAEVGQLAPNLGITATDVYLAASTNPRFAAFYPGPGIGGHCLPSDLDLLRWSHQQHDLRTPLLDAAKTVAADMPRQVISRLEAIIGDAGLDGAPILIVGVGFKPGAADTACTPAIPVVRLLRSRGAVVSYCDARVCRFEVDGQPVPRIDKTCLSPGIFAAALVMAGDPDLESGRLARSAVRVLDAGGGKFLSGPRQEMAVL